MITIKTTRNKFFIEYLKWLDPVIPLSKGERDILAAMLTLHYGHKSYAPDILDGLLFSEETKEAIRKKLRINSRLFNKLYKSLEDKKIFDNNKINKVFTKYPADGKFKLFINFEIN
mgnify:CR=1 FL=1